MIAEGLSSGLVPARLRMSCFGTGYGNDRLRRTLAFDLGDRHAARGQFALRPLPHCLLIGAATALGAEALGTAACPARGEAA